MANSKSIKKDKKDVSYVMARKNRRHGLLPMRRALNEIGNPDKDLKIIHFAGTNGKGSTVNYVKDILRSNGKKVATFTSPHLITHYDRIRINDRYITENSFNIYLNKYSDIIDKYDLGMFEIDLLIALSFFKDRKVDYVLLETGLGGRLDYTNILDNKLVEVITSIGMDHMDILGDTVQQIAFEKASIIKDRTTVIIGSKINEKAKRIIKIQANKHKANLIQTKYRKTSRYSFMYGGEEYEVSGASYQKRNAALALEVAKNLGFDIKSDKVKKAIKNSMWLGRFEEVKSKPRIIVDGAHNIEAIKALIEAMHDLPRPIITIFASLKDKKGIEMVNMLKEVSDEIIITEFENERIRHIEEYDGCDCIKDKDYKKIIEEKALSVNDGTILIAGSLYFISIVRDMLINE